MIDKDFDNVNATGMVLGLIAGIATALFFVVIGWGLTAGPLAILPWGFIYVFNFIWGFSFWRPKKTVTLEQTKENGSPD
jgi:hypothetical protein